MLEQEKTEQFIPWENRSNLGFFPAFFQTAIGVLWKPGEIFKGFRKDSSLLDPMFFCVLAYTLTHIHHFLIAPQYLLQFIFRCAISPVVLFIPVALIHVFVMLLKGKGGFRGTYAIVAYSVVKDVFLLLPVIGYGLFVVWLLFIFYHGYKTVHQFSTVKTIIILFIGYLIGQAGGHLVQYAVATYQ